jgi:hypothetical protein
MHTKYSFVPFKPTSTVPLQLQSLSTPNFPLQLPPLGRYAYSQPPVASHSLLYKLHFDSIQVE